MRLVGYADKLGVERGGEITFMVSSEPARYRTELVRLIHGDENPVGPGFKAEECESSLSAEREGQPQALTPGSYISVPDPGALAAEGDLALQMWLYPTKPERGPQTLVSRRDQAGRGYALRIDDGRLVFALGDGELRSDAELHTRSWYFVAVTYDASAESARIVVEQTSGVILRARDESVGSLAPSAALGQGELLIAAEHLAAGDGLVRGNFYNGKIDAPKVFDRVLTDAQILALRDGRAEIGARPLASWDFAKDIDSWVVTDSSGHAYHGQAANKPMRGVTGWNWDGAETAWPRAPEQYGAIHFHDDDLAEAGWEPSFTWSVPDDTRSAVYAIRLSAGEDEDFIPFVVAPRLGQRDAAIALLIPTFSYLAYANEQMAGAEAEIVGALVPGCEDYPASPEDKYIVANRLLSLYDRHSDGSGVCYSSWLRPLVNMRPKYRAPWASQGAGAPHQFPADLHLVDWLEAMDYPVDVFTDFELHRDGLERLQGYNVVLTGSHSEYWSREMLEATRSYLDGGGRLMNLSGNGVYWVTQLDGATGTGIEIRRRGPAHRIWEPEPGEGHLSTTGELGGLWRYRKPSPQSWIGNGFTAEGNGPGRPYVRSEASFDQRVAFVFDGIGADEPIGDFPALIGTWGAAGFEIDRADPGLGTPAHTIILATAHGFGDEYQVASEEILLSGTQPPGSTNPLVRADLVLLEYPNGGAVFSTGSISWCSCLSYNRYANTVSRLTQNVLNAFSAPEPPLK